MLNAGSVRRETCSAVHEADGKKYACTQSEGQMFLENKCNTLPRATSLASLWATVYELVELNHCFELHTDPSESTSAAVVWPIFLLLGMNSVTGRAFH